MYNTIYRIPFSSINQIACEVIIEKRDYVGKITELTGGSNTFSIDIESDEFLYLPLRLSTAKLRLTGNDYLRELYSTNYQQYRVLFKRNSEIVWRGFVKPEVYSQDYVSSPFELEVECISAMGALEYVQYTTTEENVGYVSLFDLIGRCVQESEGAYESIYLPYVYSRSAESYQRREDVLSEMLIGESNFFDEEGEAMTLKDILENICKFFGWSLQDWCGDLYFVDIDHREVYRKYDSGMVSFEEVTISSEFSVQKIGFSGSNHTLSILGGYNKCSVRTSNYCITGENLLEDLELDKRTPSNEFTETFSGGSGHRYRSYYISEKNWKLHIFKRLSSGQYMEYTEEEAKAIFEDYGIGITKEHGSVAIMDAGYGRDDINYNWNSAIWVSFLYYELQHISPILDILQHGNAVAYAEGALEIKAQIDLRVVADFPATDWSESDLFHINTVLSIGDSYWNGTNWVEEYSTFPLQWNIRKSINSYQNLISNKKLSDPYEGLEGYCIPLPDKPLYGKLVFRLADIKGNKVLGDLQANLARFRIKNISLKYYKKDDSESDDNTDRIYDNVVNENYINELDEIEFKISSYNNDGLCLSKVMLDGDYLRENLYCSVASKQIRPEEQLIRRIVSQYKTTKIKLTQVLSWDGCITPVSWLSDNYLVDRKFVITGGTIDYYNDSFECNMVEYNEYSD